jgi:hypothetical protein
LILEVKLSFPQPAGFGIIRRKHVRSGEQAERSIKKEENVVDENLLRERALQSVKANQAKTAEATST